jgi:hypothetical protein
LSPTPELSFPRGVDLFSSRLVINSINVKSICSCTKRTPFNCSATTTIRMCFSGTMSTISSSNRVLRIYLRLPRWAFHLKLSSRTGSCSAYVLPTRLHLPTYKRRAAAKIYRCSASLEQDYPRSDTCRTEERGQDIRWINGTESVPRP